MIKALFLMQITMMKILIEIMKIMSILMKKVYKVKQLLLKNNNNNNKIIIKIINLMIIIIINKNL